MAEKIYDIKEIAKRTRESLGKEFPNLTFSVTKESYSGGSSMTVSLMKGDINPFVERPEDGYLQLNNYYIDRDDRLTEEAKKILIRAKDIAQAYNWDKSDPMTDYFDVNYYLHMSIGKWDRPYEQTESKKSSSSKSESKTEKKSYPMGEMLDDCSGWSIFKKTLPDGRVVYNAKIKAETPKNRGDWATIKGEIYTDTTFKWGRFGAFERWGNIPNESETIEKLCQILGKYYESGEQPAPKTEISFKEGDKFFEKGLPEFVYEIVKVDKGVSVTVKGKDGIEVIVYSDAVKNFDNGNFIKVVDEEAEETPTPEAEERLFMVGDVFKPSAYPEDLFIISSISSNDEVGITTPKRPNSEAIFGTVKEVNDNFKKGVWIKVGRWDGEKVISNEAPKKSKEDIEKAIKGLQFLADKGNEKAKKAIIGLKILLNK